METILVTGGAGYIGSAAVKVLCEKGYDVIVVDNLSKGKKKLVDKKADFYEIDLNNMRDLEQIFENKSITAIMHFAGYKAVEESMHDAVRYSENIKGTINLLDCMVKHKVKRMIYSSSAAVYGNPSDGVCTEDTPVLPISYYGFTKLTCEGLMDWYSKVHRITYCALRYFNVAGDAGLSYIDPYAQNVFPIIMEVITGKRKKFVIMGSDYNTRDGTCIRDYIDIHDLIDAHVLALVSSYNGILNLGTGSGVSVKELVENFIEVTGKKFNYVMGPRREGDPPVLVADSSRARDVLGWDPKYDIKHMIKTTFDSYMKDLQGNS